MRTAAGAGAVAAGVAGGPGRSSAASQEAKYVILPFYYGAKGVQQIVTSVTGSIFQGKSDDVTAAEVNETAVQQSTWEIATSVSKGRETFVEEIRHEYGIGQSVDALQTSHGAAMWSAFETSVARSRVDGDTESAATEAARADLNKYAATSVWNNIDRWNSFWTAISTAVDKSITGEGVITPSNGSFTALEDSSQTAIDSSAVEPLVTADNKTYVWADKLSGSNVDLPSWLDLTAVAENSDATAEDLYVTRYVVDGSVVDILDPASATGQINAAHPDYGTQTLADTGLYGTLVDTTRQLRNNLSADLATTVGAIYEQFDTGQKSPSDIISAQGMLQEFDAGSGSLSEQSAVAGLVARGYAMPSDMETPATVNHADLEGETTGWLFVDTDKQLALTSRLTVSASDYEMAYIVYESAVDGSTQTAMLSGESDLEVVEYTGTTRTSLEFADPDPDETNGRAIYILEDHEDLAPESNLAVEFVGPDGKEVVDTGELNTDIDSTDPDGAQYWYLVDETIVGAPLEAVNLLDGLTIESRTTSYVSDPTNPTDTNARVDRMQEAWQTIREQLESLGGGGGGGGSGLGLGSIAALIGGGGVLAYILTGGSGR